MRQSMRVAVYLMITVVALLMGARHPAEAAFMMQLSSGGKTITLTDTDGDGLITFSGQVGDFAVNMTLGSSEPLIGSATNPVLNITSFNATSFTGGTLSIALSDTGFGDIGSSATFTTNLTTLTSGNVSAQTYFANEDANFTTAQQVGSVGALTGSASASDSVVAYNVESSFSLNMVATITHNGMGATVLGATTRVHAVPEPSATLSLGIALFGMAGYAGWRRRETVV